MVLSYSFLFIYSIKFYQVPLYTYYYAGHGDLMVRPERQDLALWSL